MEKLKTQKDKDRIEHKKNKMDKKWKSLKKRGFKRPKSSEENMDRLAQAHRR